MHSPQGTVAPVVEKLLCDGFHITTPMTSPTSVPVINPKEIPRGIYGITDIIFPPAASLTDSTDAVPADTQVVATTCQSRLARMTERSCLESRANKEDERLLVGEVEEEMSILLLKEKPRKGLRWPYRKRRKKTDVCFNDVEICKIPLQTTSRAV